MDQPSPSPEAPLAGIRKTARALLLGDRLDISGLEREDALSSAPLAFKVGQDGFVALFRWGVAVLVGLSPLEEDDVIRSLRQRIVGEFSRHEEESAVIEVSAEKADGERLPQVVAVLDVFSLQRSRAVEEACGEAWLEDDDATPVRPQPIQRGAPDRQGL